MEYNAKSLEDLELELRILISQLSSSVKTPRTSLLVPDFSYRSSRTISDTIFESEDLERCEKPLPSNTSVEALVSDVNLVDFDGPEDLLRAVNWPSSTKWLIVASLSFYTFLTYVMIPTPTPSTKIMCY